MTQEEEKYTYIAIFIHWAMALLILGMFLLGWYMEDLPKGPDRGYFFALHKSIGLTIALLLLARILWRIFHKPPALPLTIKTWQRKLATAAHHSLYLLMFLQPLTGYLSSSYAGYGTKFWGWFALPEWAEKNKELNDMFSEIHEAVSVVLLTVILIHIAGALAYLVSKHENVMRRMLPW